MLNNAQFVGFGATKNPQASKAFYQETLGLRLVEDTQFAIVFDANGTMLRLQKVVEHSPAPHTALGWHVEDIAAEIASLAGNGVSFERYDCLVQDDRAIWHSPDDVKIAWFKDPDGNVLSLTQWST